VKGLRLKGNFVLDELTWKDGKLVSATVTSNSGQPLNLRYGDKKVTVDTVAGQTYVFDENLETELPAPADKTELNKVIEQAEVVLDSGTLSHDYEKKVIDGLKSAYAAAVEVKNREAAVQEEVDAAKTVLSEALSELNNAKKDWRNLETLLKESEQILKDIKAGKYTEETAEAYQEAYNTARSLKDEATQTEINDAVKALEKAEKELDIAEPTGGEEENSKDAGNTKQDQSSIAKPENNQTGSVQTGDNSILFVWIMLMIIAAVGCGVTVYFRKNTGLHRKI
jgi:chromosome segregation ATPase